MEQKTIDARGMLCPQPVMLVKKALSEAVSGDTLRVLLDNSMACENVQRFLAGNGAELTNESDGLDFCLKAVITSSPGIEVPVAANPELRPPVVAITHSGMGHGSEELGRILIQAFLNALPSIEPLPSTIVFYNSGVHMACEGSPVLSALEKLQNSGVKIFVCGTCLEYFSLGSKRKVGVSSNMFEILTVLANAGHVIKP